jgi:hypothetical protein
MLGLRVEYFGKSVQKFPAVEGAIEANFDEDLTCG